MSSEIIEQRDTERAAHEEAQPNALTTSASPLDLPAEVFRAGLDRRKENRAALMEWVRSALVEGVDFGRIHVVSRNKCPHGARCRNPAHFSKPSLFKPGAEKICGMLGVTIHYPTLSDYEAAALQGVGLAHVIMRCEIRDATGNVVADGVGARSLRQDSGDLNKSLKMAEKSAHIDATLRMAGLSEVFTQDLEDMVHGQNLEETTGNARPSAPQTRTPAPRAATQAQGRISDAQRQRLEARISGLNLDPDRVRRWLAKASRGRVQSFSELTPKLYRRLDDRLDQWASQ
ncbi:hypothetical protein [Vreelandella gomseomensis]|uniref:Uncharacterized protein n=1 Tax=Vreelandella gomseomensis TaxID=370766 RepID=A0ABU1GC93_9GAMM|nr:hypothetical protein [Halomonas gomseomensis]MDR5875113.1 hypothetical protein [Halomonas gomseomensis]